MTKLYDGNGFGLSEFSGMSFRHVSQNKSSCFAKQNEHLGRILNFSCLTLGYKLKTVNVNFACGRDYLKKYLQGWLLITSEILFAVCPIN